MKNARLALSRVNLRDSFVMMQTADIYVANLTAFASADQSKAGEYEDAVFTALESAYGYSPSEPAQRKPFVYQDGFAIIPIHGALLNRFSSSWGFVTGYQYIRRMMNAALEDDDVEVIVYDVDSPGGESAGCMELADEIRASRTVKPSLAVVDSLSASAGYALASAASQMVATPSSQIGSIGVYRMHIDVSGALDQQGVKITFIEAPEGGMKTAGNPYEPLSDAARADAQKAVNKTYDTFVSLVAANRDITDSAVRETQARIFRAEEALALGLIDAVKTPSEAVSSFLAELADDEPNEEDEDDMSKTGTEATSATTTTPASATPAPQAAASAASVDVATAVQEALQADRQRQSAIKALPEAAKLPKLADKCALDGMTVDQAKGILEAAAAELPAPQAQTQTPAVDQTNHLEHAMDSTKQPNVGAGGESQGGGEKSEADIANSILADQGALTGRKVQAAA